MRRDQRDDEHDVIVREVGGGAGLFLAGLALGAVAALLLAPMSGAETRAEIRARAERARRQAMDAAEGLGETVREKFGEAREFVEDEISHARTTLDNKKRQVGRAVDAARDATRQTRESMERQLAESRAAFDAGAATVRTARMGDEPRQTDV
jgi:gas vesicle protein